MLRPETHFNEELERHQREVDEAYRLKEEIDKRADELFLEALDDPLTLVKMDKDYDLFQDSLGKALKRCSAAKAGHITHRQELVEEIDKIWHRLDDACLRIAEKEVQGELLNAY